MSGKDSKSSSTPKLDHIFDKTPAYLVSNLCIVNFKSYSLNNGSAWWQCALCRVINCKLTYRKCNTTTKIFGPQQRQERKCSFKLEKYFTTFWIIQQASRNFLPAELVRHSRVFGETFYGLIEKYRILITVLYRKLKNCTSNNSSLSSICFKTNKKSVKKEVKFFK